MQRMLCVMAASFPSVWMQTRTVPPRELRLLQSTRSSRDAMRMQVLIRSVTLMEDTHSRFECQAFEQYFLPYLLFFLRAARHGGPHTFPYIPRTTILRVCTLPAAVMRQK